MLDFTLDLYKKLLDSLLSRGYTSQTFLAYLESPAQKVILLRHDVDDLKENALNFAQIQHQREIKGSYYFRMIPQSYNEEVILKIAGMGHEIGYHYETMDTCKGNVEKAYEEFCRNLEKMRTLVPVRTICMHGSPRSAFDNKDLWKKYDYKELGLTGEPYYDIDFNDVAYLTDTGRRWNGSAASIRDKVESAYHYNFRSTRDIIKNIDLLPQRIMFTFHPQRWTNAPAAWTIELIMQNLKNQVKRIMLLKQ